MYTYKYTLENPFVLLFVERVYCSYSPGRHDRVGCATVNACNKQKNKRIFQGVFSGKGIMDEKYGSFLGRDDITGKRKVIWKDFLTHDGNCYGMEDEVYLICLKEIRGIRTWFLTHNDNFVSCFLEEDVYGENICPICLSNERKIPSQRTDLGHVGQQTAFPGGRCIFSPCCFCAVKCNTGLIFTRTVKMRRRGGGGGEGIEREARFQHVVDVRMRFLPIRDWTVGYRGFDRFGYKNSLWKVCVWSRLLVVGKHDSGQIICLAPNVTI
ncbi:hypothetical protein QBC38DRAFT_272163 [Podospora fimiseda]|uniref:Uncharacterized protein n=1 Tax=Podospora fimiseda TaxID=252190 RepID=A0AAN7GYG5_9PEZI|nr:hypothetical protein QBC38DRAFT_272163 [Podospora fimiseda]